jgi:hypothetical protein
MDPSNFNYPFMYMIKTSIKAVLLSLICGISMLPKFKHLIGKGKKLSRSYGNFLKKIMRLIIFK